MILNSHIDYWPQIRDIYIGGIKTQHATFEIIDNIRDYNYWLSSKIEDSCLVYKTKDNIIAGWSSLSPVSSRAVYAGVAEVSIYVDTKRAGRGIGSQLLEALINYSEKHNFWTLQSSIFPENESSIALHEKFGFRKVGYREKIAKLDGIWRDNYLFERRSTLIL